MINISVYACLYSIISAFNVYVLFRFMDLFFDRTEVNNKTEILSYIGFYVGSSIVYFVFSIPVINLVYSVIGVYLLSLNYRATIKKRLLSVVFIYLIQMSVETIAVISSGYLYTSGFERQEYKAVLPLICANVFVYLILLILKKCVNIKKNSNNQSSYWLAVFFIPAASLYVILTFFRATGLAPAQINVCFALLLLINVVVFYLYDAAIVSVTDQMERQLILQQNKYYESKFQLMNTSLKTLRGVKHDLTNHLFVMRLLAEGDKKEKLLAYIEDVVEGCGEQKEYINSGNFVVDSILNFKAQEAAQKDIIMMMDVEIPEKMNITSFDMTTILGNLLDNAIRATAELDENRTITVIVKFDRDRLILSVVNPFNNPILKHGTKLVTSKGNKDEHGIGLENVKFAVKKYEGEMKIKHENNLFSVWAVLFVEEADE